MYKRQVHNGITLHEKAILALKEITKKNKEYVLLTNAPRPNSAVKIFLEKMGMEKEIRDHVFTSGEAALSYLSKNHPNDKFFHVDCLTIIVSFRFLTSKKSSSPLVHLTLNLNSVSFSLIP